MLKCIEKDWGEGGDGRVMVDKGLVASDQGRMGTDARS
jgi:hypothetical protein